MSEQEKNLEEMVAAFDDSHIDYDHPIWERAINEGFHEELTDFTASCMIRRAPQGES
jgi:hypothetical protein